MKINKKNIVIIIAISIVFVTGLSAFGNNIKSNLTSSTSSASNITINDIDKQAQSLRLKQENLFTLKSKLNENEKTIDQTTNQKSELTQKLNTTTAQYQKLQIDLTKQTTQLQNLEKDSEITNNFDQIQQLKLQISDTNSQVKQSEDLITVQKTEIQKVEKDLESITKNRNETLANISYQNSETNNQFKDVINITLLLVSNYSIYLILILAYWAVYKFLKYLLLREIKNEIFVAVGTLTLKILWVTVSTLTLLYAFAGQFAYFFTSLGFVSAALVFALQNFIASFFVFVILNFTKIFKEGDIIKVGPSFEGYTGKIINIGRLYTFIREINPENHEEIGRTVAIPNNFLLTHPITNYTFHNKVIWQNLKIIVRENANQANVKKILEGIVNDRFLWMKGNLERYLDEDANLEEFEPSIFMALDEKGFLYTLHFPCRYDKYNFVYNTLLTDIIAEFEANDYHFAFKV
jgi:small-conductance mechanosensitive channel